MTKDEAFALWSSKHDMTAGLPWEPSHDLLKTVFTAGWDAKVEADKQTSLPLGGGHDYTSEPDITAADIYEAYPRHEGRGAAIKAIEKAMKKAGATALLDATKEYAAAVKTWAPTVRYTCSGSDTCPMPATWYNQERWADDRAGWQRGAVKHSPSQFGRTYP